MREHIKDLELDPEVAAFAEKLAETQLLPGDEGTVDPNQMARLIEGRLDEEAKADVLAQIAASPMDQAILALSLQDLAADLASEKEEATADEPIRLAPLIAFFRRPVFTIPIMLAAVILLGVLLFNRPNASENSIPLSAEMMRLLDRPEGVWVNPEDLEPILSRLQSEGLMVARGDIKKVTLEGLEIKKGQLESVYRLVARVEGDELILLIEEVK